MTSFLQHVVVLATNSISEFLTLVTFGVLAYLNPSKFTVNTVFTSLTLISILQGPLKQIGQDYAFLLGALASLKRIEVFLKQDQSPVLIEMNSQDEHEDLNDEDEDESVAVSFCKADIGWRSGDPVLREVDLEIPIGKLTMVCGRVGSGKSTLLQACLGEAQVFRGKKTRRIASSPISYCSQDVFLNEGSTIFQNIVFCSEFDSERYRSAIMAVALDQDVEQLHSRDKTKAKGELK